MNDAHYAAYLAIQAANEAALGDDDGPELDFDDSQDDE